MTDAIHSMCALNARFPHLHLASGVRLIRKSHPPSTTTEYKLPCVVSSIVPHAKKAT